MFDAAGAGSQLPVHARRIRPVMTPKWARSVNRIKMMAIVSGFKAALAWGDNTWGGGGRFPSDKKESGRCSGVGKRAGKVNSDHLRKARRADIEYNGHDRNSPLDGPIARRLKEYERVKAFVVGPRAEMSSDLHSLINCISERAAVSLGCSSKTR